MKGRVIRHEFVLLGVAALSGGCQALLSFSTDERDAASPVEPEGGAAPDGAGGDGAADVGVNEDAALQPDARDAAVSAYVTAVVADSPALYLRLGEPAGTMVAFDTSAHARTGAYIGPPTLGVAGGIAGDLDTAVRFEGTLDQLVRVVDAVDFSGVAPFTVEALVRPEADGPTAFQMIVGTDRWLLFIQQNILKLERQDGNSFESAQYAATLPRDRFTHVAGSFDGTFLRLYVNAVAVAQVPASTALPPSAMPIEIGRYLPGTIDEVAVYDHALAAARISAHYTLAGP